MAMSVNGGNGFGSRRRRGGAALSEINVTPFVDVVLVLLIIFMLTAHVMEFGVEVDVPKVKYVKETSQDLPVVSISKTGVTTLNDQTVNLTDLAASIRRRFPNTKGVFVRADKETIWDVMAQVTAELGAAKFPVYLVTQPEDSAAKRRK
jgi:biopolymer transport protein ExbD